MLTIESRVETDQSSRYLVRLCKHAASMGRPHVRGPQVHLGGELSRREVEVRAEWSETHGTITLSPWGRCGIEATTNALVLRIEATDEENLSRIQDIITRDLDRFGGSEHLTVDWHRT